VEDEHVADNMDGGGVATAAELDDRHSTSYAGYQAADEGEDEVLSNRRQVGGDGVRNLAQRRVRARLA
jgi:hypothetical protein